jgi:hypothetical protein
MKNLGMSGAARVVLGSFASLLWVGALGLASCTGSSSKTPEAVGQSQSALCSGQPVLTASPMNDTEVGTPVTFTLTPSCDMGDTPEWQLYILPQGATSWTPLFDYTPTLTYTWDTSSVAVGTYFFEANVKSTASDAPYDSYVTMPYYNVNPPGSCSAVAASTSPDSAAAGTPITISATSTCPSSGSACAEGPADGCAQYRFWVQPFAGVWEILQDWSDSAAATFTGNDSAVHTGGKPDYRFEVDVRGYGDGNPDYDTYTVTDYSYASTGSCPAGDTVCNTTECIDTMTDPENCGGCAQDSGGSGVVCTSPQTCNAGVCGSAGTCSSVTGSATPSSAPAGTDVTLTGDATCGEGSAEYEFWIQPPGGSWTVVQAYSASNTYTWNTTGLSPGGYLVEIDAKEAGSTGGYQSYALLTVDITASQTCSSVTASAAPSDEAAGNVVTVTGSATCSSGATPLYRFWVMPPNGGVWQLYQDWSTSATASFIGSDATAAYSLEIDTVAQGNGNTGYDSWTEIEYQYASSGACPTGYTTCDVSVCSCGACGAICSATQTCSSGTCM